MIVCRGCGSEFQRKSKHGNAPIFCTPECRGRWHYESDRERSNAYARKWRAANRERVRWLKVQSQYGLTQDAYEQLFVSQGSACAICQSPSPCSSNWHIDHDHNCCPPGKSCGGCVRGILCGPCNRGLGYFKDDPRVIAKAAAYVERMSMVRGV